MHCQKTVWFRAYLHIICMTSDKFVFLLLLHYLLSSIHKNGSLVHKRFSEICIHLDNESVSEELCKPNKKTCYSANVEHKSVCTGTSISENKDFMWQPQNWKRRIGCMMMNIRTFIFSRLRIHLPEIP